MGRRRRCGRSWSRRRARAPTGVARGPRSVRPAPHAAAARGGSRASARRARAARRPGSARGETRRRRRASGPAGRAAAPPRPRRGGTRGSSARACARRVAGTSRRTSPGRPVRGAGGGAWSTDTIPRGAMPSWQERIKDSSEPALRAERDARYRYAAPAIAAADVWCDVRLEGTAPDPPEGFAGEALVVSPDELSAALAGKTGVVVTCFDVIVRLESFAAF